MSSFLGIDTSNYTTSVALCGDVDRSVRRLLDVPDGARGIRQSDGVFMHIKQLPSLYEELLKGIDVSEIKAVGVSTRPRSVDGSYMPVFVPGESFARVCAATLGVPLYEFSHQDGHIMAGICSCGDVAGFDGEFYSVHLSGGTCEILKSRFTDFGFCSEIVGGTKDISAGQLIDRVGVSLGMKFPCGREVTENALLAEKSKLRLSVSADGGYINLSGAETQAIRLVDSADKAQLCRAVLECIGKSLIKALCGVGAEKVLMVGGVSSSEFLKKFLIEEGKGIDFSFASSELSTDNAYGIARLAQRRYEYGAENCNGKPDKRLH